MAANTLAEVTTPLGMTYRLTFEEKRTDRYRVEVRPPSSDKWTRTHLTLPSTVADQLFDAMTQPSLDKAEGK